MPVIGGKMVSAQTARNARAAVSSLKKSGGASRGTHDNSGKTAGGPKGGTKVGARTRAGRRAFPV